MADPSHDMRTPSAERRLRRDVDRRMVRKVRAREAGKRPVWFSLGLMGLVGWSVAVPTLAGIALGWWIDSMVRGRVSWTLTLLFVGVVIGCFNAWYWVRQESADD